MKTAALIISGLAIAGLWAWAVTTRVELTPLPERYCGTFRVFRFEPPDGTTMANPLLADQHHRYEFRADGTYCISILVSGGYEMLRSEGMLGLDRQQVLTLSQLSLKGVGFLKVTLPDAPEDKVVGQGRRRRNRRSESITDLAKPATARALST